MDQLRITPQEVKQRLDRGEQFVFLDDRNPQAWAAATTKLPHALRIPADEAARHLGTIPREHSIVTYCT